MATKLSDFLNLDFTASQGSQRKPGHKSSTPMVEGFDFIKLIQSWPSIVGEKLSAETIPMKNRHGVLTVLTRHAAFSEQIKFMEEMLKTKIGKTFPSLKGKIKRINFISNPEAFVTKQDQAKKIRKAPAPLDQTLHPQSPEFKKRQLEAKEYFKDVEDPEVFAALASLYIQLKP